MRYDLIKCVGCGNTYLGVYWFPARIQGYCGADCMERHQKRIKSEWLFSDQTDLASDIRHGIKFVLRGARLGIRPRVEITSAEEFMEMQRADWWGYTYGPTIWQIMKRCTWLVCAVLAFFMLAIFVGILHGNFPGG